MIKDDFLLREVRALEKKRHQQRRQYKIALATCSTTIAAGIAVLALLGTRFS